MKPEKLSAKVRSALIELARQRVSGKSICPSEAARRVQPEAWRDLMPMVHETAGELVLQGILQATQRGKTVNLAEARGPYRLIYISAESFTRTQDGRSDHE